MKLSRLNAIRLNNERLNAGRLNNERLNAGRLKMLRSNTGKVLRRLREDEGAATAEYAVATMAAVGFAGLLIVILRGDEVRGILTDLVRNALTVG